MNNPTLVAIWLLFLFPFNAFSQTLDERKTNIFPNDGPTPYDLTGFSFTDNYVASNSFWASPFTEDYVYHARLKYDHPANPDMSYELRLGKGGHIYSFLTSAGETVPPQYPATAPWVDEVWQMVAVDGTLNDPNAGKKYFIHQAGVYLKTESQTLPFYSPIVARYYNSSDNSYTIVNWGQQAHTSDNQVSGYTSAMLYYTRFKNLGMGVIQVDLLMYNFGNDNMNFINIPWGGVRQSTYDHWFSSNTDHTYQEETGSYTSYHEQLNNTGGWAAWSTNAQGNAPTLALLMYNGSGVLRMGDAGTISNRDYTVFEGIQFPGTNLGPGKSIRARNYYLLNSDIDDIKTTIVNDLQNETFYGTHNFASNQVDSAAYSFEFQGSDLVATEVAYTSGLQLKLRPYQNSKPLFLIKATNGTFRITTDLYAYSTNPYDGLIDTIQLLGFRDNSTQVEIKNALICSGESYTFSDGTTTSNITNTTYHISNAGTAYNGYDSLIFTTVYVSPTAVSATTFVNNGPGGVSSVNGGTSLALWLDADQLQGVGTTNPDNGTSVDTWTDLSGNNDHYKSAGVNRPTYNSVGTFNAVNFDNTAADPQYLTGAYQDEQPYGTVFIALKATDAGNNNPLLSNARASLKYEQNTNSGLIGYTDISNSTDYTSTLSAPFDADNIVSFHTDCATNVLNIYVGNNATTLTIGSTTNGIPLGQLGTASERVSGDIYEILAFNNAINTAQKILIDNYLSAKYGSISIANNLYDEDETANGDFDYDVAGIGRVDANNLHDDARGTGIIRINTPSNLDDGEFLIWGNNGQALAFTNTTDLPTAVLNKTERVWRVSEVNTSLNAVDVGTVDLLFDLSDLNISPLQNVVLILDTNNDGNFADETFITANAHTQTDYEGQADVLFSGLNLQDGTRFCLGYLAPDGPGGIYNNLALWLAADGQVSLDGAQVNMWTDKSENAKVATGGLGPTFATSNDKLLNYNPVITMDGVNDNFQTTSVFGSNTYTDFNFFVVTRINAAPHNSSMLLEHVNGGTIQSHLPWSNGRVFWDVVTSDGTGRLHQASGLSNGDDAIWQLSTHDGVPDLQYIRKNGKTIASDNSTYSITGSGNSLNLGSNGSGHRYNGDLAEVIIYVGNVELTNSEVLKIESYLAFKYGKTLDNTDGGTAGDLINSNHVTIWDADDNNTYHHEVIGIGRDDASDLTQKQSNTRDDSVSVFVGNLADYNSLNAATITNNFSSIVIGHNQGLLTDPTNGSNTEKPSGIYERLQREWKVTNTNFTDDFALSIKCGACLGFNTSDIRLLVDDDGDFTNATAYNSVNVAVSSGSLVISGISTSIIPTNTTQYITIGAANASAELFPVEFRAFNAIANSGIVYLDWQTATEIDNDFFIVQRSINGRNWESILRLDGVGNSSTVQYYEAIDHLPHLGQSYYRLQQTDIDGQIGYSAIRPIYIAPQQKSLRVYPNPTHHTITIEGNQSDLSALRIWNILGQDVTAQVKIITKDQKVIANLSQLPIGLYTIKTKSDAIKVIKE